MQAPPDYLKEYQTFISSIVAICAACIAFAASIITTSANARASRQIFRAQAAIETRRRVADEQKSAMALLLLIVQDVREVKYKMQIWMEMIEIIANRDHIRILEQKLYPLEESNTTQWDTILNDIHWAKNQKSSTLSFNDLSILASDLQFEFYNTKDSATDAVLAVERVDRHISEREKRFITREEIDHLHDFFMRTFERSDKTATRFFDETLAMSRMSKPMEDQIFEVERLIWPARRDKGARFNRKNDSA